METTAVHRTQLNLAQMHELLNFFEAIDLSHCERVYDNAYVKLGYEVELKNGEVYVFEVTK